MLSFFTAWGVLWVSATVLPLTLKKQPTRNMFAWLLPISGLTLLAIFWEGTPPWWSLAASALGMLYLFKGSISLIHKGRHSIRSAFAGHLLYMTIWPGMGLIPARKTQATEKPAGTRFIHGLIAAHVGLGSLIALILLSPWLSDHLIGWLAIFALLTLIHLGISEILTSLLWLAGWEVTPLFKAPLRSTSLRDFWSRRWNIAFIEMDRLLFMRPLVRLFGMKNAVFGIFLLSGLLHEMAISYPVQQGWGLPLTYFAIQALGISLEKRFQISSRIWAWGWILVPLPLLFHTAFRQELLIPMIHSAHGWLTGYELKDYFSVGLWLMGIAHFLVLIASFQVPKRLGWNEELSKLSNFNRKYVWATGGFIVLIIVCFGVLTLALRSEFLNGSPAAIGLTLMITAFWLARLALDAFYYESSDWPKGESFIVGHALLTSLFTFFVLSYGSLAIWQLWG